MHYREPMSGRVGWVTLASVLLILAGGAGCTRDLSEIEERQAAWEAAGIEDYLWSLTVREPLFGSRRVDIEVKEGAPHGVVLDGEDVAPGQAGDVPLTIDELYGRLLATARSAVSLDVVWNLDPPYPVRIQIDESDALDDELTYEVLSVRPDQMGQP
jgi:hypothetical protein